MLLTGLSSVFSTLSPALRERLSQAGTLCPATREQPLVFRGRTRGLVCIARNGILFQRAHPRSGLSSGVTEFYKAGVLVALPAHHVYGRIYAVRRSNVVVWDIHEFFALAAQDPNLAQWAFEEMQSQTTARYAEALSADVYSLEALLAHLQWRLAEPYIEGRRLLSTRLPQSLMAEYFRISREEVSRKKQLLEKSGYIQETSQGVILDSLTPSLFAIRADSAHVREFNPLRPFA